MRKKSGGREGKEIRKDWGSCRRRRSYRKCRVWDLDLRCRGETARSWDFIVWAGPGAGLLRVQVKATGRLNGGGYDVQPVYATRDGEKKWYTKEDIDVLAAHVVWKIAAEKRGICCR